MPRVDGVTAIAVVLIASFAIDRIATLLLAVLGRFEAWRRRFPDAASLDDAGARAGAEEKRRLAYLGLAAPLSTVVLAGFGQVRILAAVGFPTDAWLDVVVTGLLLTGGSDRVAALLQMPGAPGVAKSEPKPIAITGTLVLEGRRAVTSDE